MRAAALRPASCRAAPRISSATFVALRLAGRKGSRLPAALWFWAGSLLTLLSTLMLVHFELP